MGMVYFNIIMIASKWLPHPQHSFFSLNQQIKLAFFCTGIYYLLYTKFFSSYYVKSGPALCPLYVTSALDELMQTSGQRCSCSNTLASDSKQTVYSYYNQQRAVFNYFHHLSILSLSLFPTLSLSFPFLSFFLQVLRNRGFESGSFLAQNRSLHHLVCFCTVNRKKAIF